jgi:DNA-binding CsgD family transcriptional regulator
MRETSEPAAPWQPGSGDLVALLTPREREVLHLYLQLLNDKKVARCLGLRPQTIRNHLAAIERKLAVHGRAALISLVLSRRNNAE